MYELVVFKYEMVVFMYDLVNMYKCMEFVMFIGNVMDI